MHLADWHLLKIKIGKNKFKLGLMISGVIMAKEYNGNQGSN